jgi:hypothetical protein
MFCVQNALSVEYGGATGKFVVVRLAAACRTNQRLYTPAVTLWPCELYPCSNLDT